MNWSLVITRWDWNSFMFVTILTKTLSLSNAIKMRFSPYYIFPLRYSVTYGCRQHRTLQIAAYVFVLIWGFTCKYSLSLGSWHLSDSQLLCFISPPRGRPSTFRSPLLTLFLGTVLLHEMKVLLCCCPLFCSASEQQGFKHRGGRHCCGKAPPCNLAAS